MLCIDSIHGSAVIWQGLYLAFSFYAMHYARYSSRINAKREFDIIAKKCIIEVKSDIVIVSNHIDLINLIKEYEK